MRKDFLFDAMNEISDEHIAEAATYELKDRKINLKAIISIAACLIVVAVSGFALSYNNTPVEPTASNGTVSHTYAPTTQPTTVAGTSTTCAPVRDWEDMNYGERFIFVTINGERYVFCNETVSDETTGDILGSVKVSVEYLKDDFRSATAEIYEIKGLSSDVFAAIKFTEDEKGEYFLYYNSDYAPSTLGDYIDDTDAFNNFNFKDKTITYRNDYSNGDFLEVTYRIDEKIQKEFMEMLKRHREVVCEPKDFHKDAETAELYTEVMNQTHMIYLTGAGEIYTYFGTDDNMFCFNIGSEEFRTFVSFLESEAEIIETVMGCPTAGPVTTPTTQPASAFTKNNGLVTTTLPAQNSAVDLKDCDTLGEFAEQMKTESGGSNGYDPDVFCTSYRAYYKQDGKEDIVYSICIETMESLRKLLVSNSDKQAVIRKSETGEKLLFDAYINSQKYNIYLCNDGWLYISDNDSNERVFEIGIDAYNEFMREFYGSSCVWTPEHPVTMG